MVVKQAVRFWITQRTCHDLLGFGLNRREAATALNNQLAVGAFKPPCTVADDVVPNGLDTVFRNREWHAGLLIVDQPHTARKQFDIHRLLGNLGIFLGGKGQSAVARVHVHLVVGILLDHGLVAISQDIRILRHIGCTDGIQRLFVCVGINVIPASTVPGRSLSQPPGPRWNAAVSIGGLFGSCRSQILPQLRYFCAAQLGVCEPAIHCNQAAKDGCLQQFIVHC
ncbi:hypothetical protein D9M68_500140 [compost metagenome]